MVVANTTSGETRHFDLRDPPSVGALLRLIQAGEVTALSINLGGAQHTLPHPKRFNRRFVAFGAEPILDGQPAVPIGERIFVQAEDVRATLTATYSSRVVRCDLVKTGRLLYSPLHRGTR